MQYNLIHICEDISVESPPVIEPVGLQEVKDYLRLEGFQADDDSPADAFMFDDDLINDLITEARMWVENYTGVHLIRKQLRVVLTNTSGNIELPGPVTGTPVATDECGTALTVRTVGADFPILLSPALGMITLIYPAGYATHLVPAWARSAIKAYVADHYEFRGDDAPPAANVRAVQKCRPHRKAGIWA